jgi:hypothetical protein
VTDGSGDGPDAISAVPPPTVASLDTRRIRLSSSRFQAHCSSPAVPRAAVDGGRSDLTYADLQHLDSVYVRSWSLMWDVRIIAKTPHVVFARKGAY